MADFYCTLCERQMFSQPYWDSHINGRPHKEKMLDKLADEGKVEPKRFKLTHTCYVCLTDHNSVDDLKQHETTMEHKEKLEALFQEAESHLDPADSRPPIIVPGDARVIAVVKSKEGVALVTLYAKFHNP